MNTLIRTILVALSFMPLSAQTVGWDWLSPKFAACEGVGINGTYRVYVKADVRDLDNQRKRIRSIAVYAGSAALQQNKGELSGQVSIKKDGAAITTARFVRQSPNSIAESPKGDETPRMFLPDGKELEVPRGATVAIEVSLAIKMDSGSCSLGSTSNYHDLFK